jgi:hypothetical protein
MYRVRLNRQRSGMSEFALQLRGLQATLAESFARRLLDAVLLVVLQVRVLRV